MPKIKNIIIFVSILAVLISFYFFFFRNTSGGASLTSSTNTASFPVSSAPNNNSTIGKDFLTLLLSIKNIKLDDSIFSDNAFTNLHDSSIDLIPDDNEGRPNPFAPIGSDTIVSPADKVGTKTKL